MAFSRARTTAWILASLLLAASAHAEPTAADRETARTLMQQGRELRAKGDLKQALKRFQAADDIMHVPSTSLEVARAQVAIGQLVEARDTIATIRRIPPKPNEPTPFKEARAKAEELDSSLNGRVPSLNIAVKGAADGETPTVSIDGDALPAAVVGLPRAVDPGHHVVVAKTAGAEGKTEVDVNEGEQKAVEITLVAGPPTVAATTPETPEPTEAAPETPSPSDVSHSPTLLTWTGVGVAGVGVIAGTVTGIASLLKKSSLETECTNHVCGPTSYSDYSAANTLATISTIGFIAAGAGAAFAAVTVIVGHHPAGSATTSTSAASATVRATVGFGTIGLSGTF